MPAQDGAGADQPVHTQLWRQEPDQRGGDCTVGPVEAGPRMGPVQHGGLMAQHEQPGVLGSVERPGRTSQPQSRTKMRQSRRTDTNDHDAVP